MYIRSATVDDVEKLFEIRCSVHENHMSREAMAALDITSETVQDMIRSGDYIVPMAITGHQAVGFAMAQISEGYVFALFVTPAHEGKGIGGKLLDHIGGKLLDHVEAALQQHGVREAWLATDADERIRAVGFYRHHGWRAVGLMEDGQLRFCKQLHQKFLYGLKPPPSGGKEGLTPDEVDGTLFRNPFLQGGAIRPAPFRR